MSVAAYDGDYSTPQIASPLDYEIPFKTDPKRYVYRVCYWQFDQDYAPLSFGDPGPFGGYYVGVSTIKPVGGGIIEFHREFSIVPDTRSEYESFVYSYQIVLLGQQGGITEVPLTVQSRIQFDYFRTDDPQNVIDLPKAPHAIQILSTIYPLNDWVTLWNAPTGTEFLATDATYKIWRGNIYERQQRFVRSISYLDLFAF